jgi:protein gp37
MGENTKIEWADHTFNPWIGCTKVSPGCDNCYAEKLATARLGVAWGPHAERRLAAESTLKLPYRWNRAAQRTGQRPRVFCASLADVFDNAVNPAWLLVLLDIIRETPNLDWLLLTKRPQLITRRLEEAIAYGIENADRGPAHWETGPAVLFTRAWLAGQAPAQVWLGTTVENQAEADRRIPHLLAVPARVRFLSCEPLLGPVDLGWLPYPASWPRCDCEQHHPRVDALAGTIMCKGCCEGPEAVDARIDWVIAGGESGPGARPAHPDWFRGLRDQCEAAVVPFFFKQWGDWIADDQRDSLGRRISDAWVGGGDDGREGLHWWAADGPEYSIRIPKKAAGALLDGREHREVPTP